MDYLRSGYRLTALSLIALFCSTAPLGAQPPSPYRLDPALDPMVQCTFAGWWCLEEKDRLVGELTREMDARKRKAIIERIQLLFYEDVGLIKFGDLFALSVVRRELRGDFRSVPFFHFWNAWQRQAAGVSNSGH